jgi:hypothetical protein
MSTRTIQLILAGALMATAAFALAETYIPIDFPGAIVTDASGINSKGEIVGTYIDAHNGVHGFASTTACSPRSITPAPSTPL